ncbi:MAG: hypothetical protein KAV82_01625 [Phycisphaerae bacterium]|nr:hypothetical protein [Phycisphaerae bacterium]
MDAPKRMSVFTAIVLGISAILIVCIVSSSLIVLYGMRIVDRKVDRLVGTASVLIEQLPALKAALPPALADATRDERRPDYVNNLKIEVDMHSDPNRSRITETSISVTNEGDEVVSMLALRVVVLDHDGRPMSARTEYVATPLAIDKEWRGPLLPGSKRHATTTHYGSYPAGSVEYEVTEIRVWQPEGNPDHSPPRGVEN